MSEPNQPTPSPRPRWYCASCGRQFVDDTAFYRRDDPTQPILHDEDDEGTAACGPILPMPEPPAE